MRCEGETFDGGAAGEEAVGAGICIYRRLVPCLGLSQHWTIRKWWVSIRKLRTSTWPG